MVVSKIFYCHPYLGKIPILTTVIFFIWVETTNQGTFLYTQVSMFIVFFGGYGFSLGLGFLERFVIMGDV